MISTSQMKRLKSSLYPNSSQPLPFWYILKAWALNMVRNHYYMLDSMWFSNQKTEKNLMKINWSAKSVTL